MIYRLVLLLSTVLCFSPAFAQDEGDEQLGRHFSRDEAFSRPMDPVLAYKNAQDVVLQSVDYSDLPKFIRSDIEQSLGTCPDGTQNMSAIKSYSYVSSMIRTKGLSPNYLVDFSGYATPDPKSPPCGAGLMCRDGSCLLSTYSSHEYQQWKRGMQFTHKGWVLGALKDPKVGHPLTILDVSTVCQTSTDQSPAEDTADNLCHSRYIWMFGNLVPYPLPNR